MKHIEQNLSIGYPDLALEIQMSLDGRVIYDGPANCLIANFVKFMQSAYGNMNMNNLSVVTGYYNSSYFWSDRDEDDDASQQPFNIESYDDNGTLRPLFDRLNRTDNNEAWHFTGIDRGGSWSPLNGYQEVVWVDSDRCYLPNEVYDANDSVPNEARALPINHIGSFQYDPADIFKHPKLHLGRDERPLGINQQYLDYIHHGTRWDELDYEGQSTSSATIVGQESWFEFSRDILNNSGQDVQVREMGINAEAHTPSSNYKAWALIARDLINILIPHGSTVNVRYRIKIKNESDGGFTSQWLQMLRSKLTEQEPTITKTNGGTFDGSNYNSTESLFTAIAPGGSNRVDADRGTEGRHWGPVVGSGTASADIEDIALASQISHGNGSGELIYHGTSVEETEIDEVNDVANFKIHRFFENRSGSPVDINETGIYHGVGNDLRIDSSEIWCGTRHVLGSPVTVANGETAKLTYTFNLAI